MARKPRSNRGWQALSLVLGGIFGVTISLARTTHSNKPVLEPHPAVAHASATSAASIPASASMPSSSLWQPSATDPATSAWHPSEAPLAKKNKKSAHKRQGVGPSNQAPKNETREGSQPRGKGRRAFAANGNNTRSPSWPSSAQRGVVQREAAELGLKSPW
jgi:hypothetical protein